MAPESVWAMSEDSELKKGCPTYMFESKSRAGPVQAWGEATAV